MISRAVWVLVAIGCGKDAPSSRSRVLDKIPAGVTSLAVAEGHALSHPRLRPLVDVLRTEVPAGFDCVVDAALAGQQAAIGVGPSGDVTVVIETKAHVSCPALGQVETGVWVATLGAGAPAAGGMTDTRLARARPYLRTAPIAVFTEQGDLRVLATAQPEPLAAWIAFDAPDAAEAIAFETELRATLATSNEAIAPVARAVAIERTGSQVVARLGATRGDLAVALREALALRRARFAAPVFACPSPLAPPVLGCKQRDGAVQHEVLQVYSLAAVVDELLAANKEAVIVNGRVEGVRLRDELPTYGLRAGDLLVAIDGRKLSSLEQAATYLQKSRSRTQLVVSRQERLGTIELVEP